MKFTELPSKHFRLFCGASERQASPVTDLCNFVILLILSSAVEQVSDIIVQYFHPILSSAVHLSAAPSHHIAQ